MATIDLTRFSPDYLEAAKPKWKALSEDHEASTEGGDTNEHFEIDFR